MSQSSCIIIGASHAAGQLAPSLRQEGWEGRIIVVGEEPYLPYNRPPLSKTFLSGSKSTNDLLIRGEASYQKADIEFKLGVKVMRIDRSQQTIELSNGETLPYTKLALTTGAKVCKTQVPGSELNGIHYLRNINDVNNIRSQLSVDKRVVIIGGGYIGLETAAMLNALKIDVTLLVRKDRVLNRVSAPQVSDFYHRIHQEEGVNIVTEASLSYFEGNNHVSKVYCEDGRSFDADLVVLGIGVYPNVELAEQAGLEVNNGIVVDANCCTSDTNIVAAGDCAWHFNEAFKREMRLESVQNAVDQAKIAAATVCGNRKEYNALPWFWSDQFDTKLQIAGLSDGYDELVIRGDIKQGRKFAAFYFKQELLLAVDAVNSPQEFMMGKRIISAKQLVDKTKLAESAISMKDVVISSE